MVTLLEAFGTLSGICQADEQQLLLCPGIGDKKVKRLYQALHEPFKPKTHNTSGVATGIGKKRRMEMEGGGVSDDTQSGLESVSMPASGSGLGGGDGNL